jgi:hypothetical protein
MTDEEKKVTCKDCLFWTPFIEMGKTDSGEEYHKCIRTGYVTFGKFTCKYSALYRKENNDQVN